MKWLSRLVNWLEFYPLKSGTADEWCDWGRQFKQQAPIRFRLFGHTGVFRTIQIIIKRRYVDFILFFAYRTYDKYHIVPTKLPPGYYDVDTRMLYSCFTLLEHYIAVDKGSKQYWCITREDKKASRKYWKYKIPFVYELTFNEPQLGLDYLAWEMSLSDEDGGGDGEWTQRKVAQEQYDLYIWWTVTRPNRKPMPYPQQLVDFEAKHQSEDVLFALSNRYKKEHPELYEIQQKYWDEDSAQERQWRDEDNQMLQRLVEIRGRMW